MLFIIINRSLVLCTAVSSGLLCYPDRATVWEWCSPLTMAFPHSTDKSSLDVILDAPSFCVLNETKATRRVSEMEHLLPPHRSLLPVIVVSWLRNNVHDDGPNWKSRFDSSIRCSRDDNPASQDTFKFRGLTEPDILYSEVETAIKKLTNKNRK